MPMDGRADQPIRFDRDIRPLLAKSCFRCHGRDETQRAGGLRLDLRRAALSKLPSGRFAIVPGKVKSSELIRRVSTKEDDERMPPPGEPHALSAQQVRKLRQWIRQGATWGRHWAFQIPRRPSLPLVANRDWPVNAIDFFVLARMEKQRLRPSPQAERRTLIRRVTLDLTGLPPTPDEIRQFLSDRRPRAYERLVERLLSSPRYGERMGVAWLDAARYADTNGHFMDNERQMWAWRDWVVRAFNSNMAFDRFTIEQLAGDLLPAPTVDQLTATGFHRNHGINFEAGAIDEEFRVEYVVDRVNTTGTIWLGLTLGCAQCHPHKYDPISQSEYYQLFAYFNNNDESGVDGNWGNASPIISLPSASQRRVQDRLRKRLSKIQKRCRQVASQIVEQQSRWEEGLRERFDQLPTVPDGMTAYYPLNETSGYDVSNAIPTAPDASVDGVDSWSIGRFGGGLAFHGDTSVDAGDLLAPDRDVAFSAGAWIFSRSQKDGAILARMDDYQGMQGFDFSLQNGKLTVRLSHDPNSDALTITSLPVVATDRWYHVTLTYDGSSSASGLSVYLDGKLLDTEISKDCLTSSIGTEVSLRIGRRFQGGFFQGVIDDVRLFDRALNAPEVARLAAFNPHWQIVQVPTEERTESQQTGLLEVLAAENHNSFVYWLEQIAKAQHQLRQSEVATPTTMVMQEREEMRPTHVLMRGKYDALGTRVQPATPKFLPRQDSGAPTNRLSLARWLVRSDHPLTARVTVNRIWQAHFGRGIVTTPRNFGVQGDKPSHPQLLDWLATEFVQSRWDMKALHRLIVTSATYKQSSHAGETILKLDPRNRWLSRATRRRHTAEMIRDAALFTSGLLAERQGGPGVNPYQPPGLWKEMAFRDTYKGQEFVQSRGESLYRRSLYTFWKRTCPPPGMATFDAPSRESCCVKRGSTNTALQALLLMNGTTYVEAARYLADQLLRNEQTDSDRIEQAYLRILGRPPRSAEQRILLELLKQQRERYGNDLEAARQLVQIGETRAAADITSAELAAWTVVASTIFNLDEAITSN